ncbi:hypothetical protein BDZ88DRAFT_476427 [Geranomyces variabilis]|nr:hypothetical protein BDZ88DRAFT_476427 [Geranomyces variabilis]
MPSPDHEVIEVHELRSTASYDVPLAAVADEKYLAYHHLSGDEAQRRLLAAADEVLATHQGHARDGVISAITKQSTIVTGASALGLIGFFISAQLLSSPYQWRATGALVEAIIVLATLLWNVWLQIREAKFTVMEMSMRIRSIVEPLKKNGLSRKPDLKLPTSIGTVSLCRVVRDQTIVTLPFNLVVLDDIVQLAYGDTAPCRVRYVNSHFDTAPTAEGPEYVLEKGQLFRPSLFASSPLDPTIMRRAALNEGQFHFRALETPLRDTLSKALGFKRPETVVQRQFAVLADYYFTRLMWGMLGVALLVNALRYGIRETGEKAKLQQGVEYLLVMQIYVILPLLPLVVPTLFMIIRSFGNAQILSLFDALQTSKTEFEDNEDIDEFDSAPPPTKDLVLDWALVWKRFLDQFVQVDVSFLARTTGLVASLASTTVICAIDREGTISLPTPSVEQLFLLDTDGDPVVLDVLEDTSGHAINFEDRDWQQYLPTLKPLGLNLLLNTDCGAHHGRIRPEHHRKSNGHHAHGRVRPGRQACLCQLGREIGFSVEAMRGFTLQKSIHCFAPQHPTVAKVPDYHFEIPSFVSQIFQETASQSFQLFSEGNVDLIMESCSDYWNGKTLGVLDEATEKKITDFCQNALINDAQVVAFAYRPIENTKATAFFLKPRAVSAATIEGLYIEHPGSRTLGSTTLSASGSAASLPPEEPPQPSSASSTSSTPSEKLRPKPPKKRYLNNIDRVRPPVALDEKQLCGDLVKSQTFLGIASLAYQPKGNVVDFIEDLGIGGIRFVYFSSAPERESKAYAERLGLEIDWNSCILLSSANGDTPGYLEEHDMKARLPRGVDKIRDHLRDVDDVPLHVSLFAECEPASIIEMVRIFQEQGEVVCCIGSSLNEMNVECFSLADVSIAIDPLSALKLRNYPLNGPISPLSLGAAFASSPCAFSLHSDTSIYSLSQIIRDARTISDSGRQAIAFYLACQTSLPFIMILASCMLLPPVFAGYQLLWIMWIILPPLTLSFLFSPYDPNVMTRMPAKNSEHLKDRWRFVAYFATRFIGPILVTVGVFAVTLAEFNDATPFTTTDIFGGFGKSNWMHLTDREQWALLYAQNCALFVWVLLMVFISGTFLDRTASLRKRPPYHNRIWAATAVVTVALQAIFMAVSLAPGRVYSLSVLSWWVYVVALAAAPVIIVAAQEVVKVHDRREWEKFQKRSKLEFNTKLGMHSPL